MANIAVATWTVELDPSEQKTFKLPNSTDLKITNAALGPQLVDENGRSTVIIHIDNDPSGGSDDEDSEEELSPAPPQKLILTSLIPGKIESSIHDTIITRPALVTFEVVGKNIIHLSGYLYTPPNEYSDDDDDDEYRYGYDEDEEDEELSDLDSDLHGAGSDVEVTLRDLNMMSPELQDDSHRFEEINESEIGTKRPRESDDEPEVKKTEKVVNGAKSGEKLSKKEQKRLKAQQKEAEAEEPPQKKIKGADGQAVAVEKKDAEGGKKGKKEKKEKEGKKEKGEAKPEAKKEAQVTKHSNGLVVKDSKVGSGATVKNGSKVEIRYIGKLTNGTVFDSNVSGPPFRVVVGSGSVIKGMDQGLVGMKEKGERIITIPPQLGYGKQPMGKIPKNSTLTFEIKLLKVS